MSTIKLSSQNPNFSWLLGKNPETQYTSGKPFKKNTAYLSFEDNGQSVILHQKNVKDSNDYISVNGIVGGDSYLKLIKSHMSSLTSKKAELDTDYKCQLEFSLYTFNGVGYQGVFPNNIEEVVKNHVSTLTVFGQSVYDVLGMTSVLCLLSIAHDKNFEISKEQYVKYIEISLKNDVSYKALRTLFNTIPDMSTYNTCKDISAQYLYGMERGNAFDSRQQFYVNANISRSKSLLDIGVGEGNYFKKHIKFYDYINALEPDEKVFYQAEHMVKKYKCQDKLKLHNVDGVSYLNNIENLHDTDVLITEVLEHMQFDESVQLLKKIISLEPNNIIVTFPNKSFNYMYGLKDDEMRHDDHVWEGDNILVTKMLKEVYTEKYHVETSTVGDRYLKDSNFSFSAYGLVFKKNT